MQGLITMLLEGLTKLQVELADQLWKLETMDEVERFINKLPIQLKAQAKLVMAMMEVSAIDDIISDDDLDLANEVISLVK
jgi:hypothetical protein